MNEEQKAGLAKITARIRIKHWSQCGITSDDGEWLLALVKELDEENSRQAVLLNGAAGRHVALEMRAERAEQQLAAVTAERDAFRETGPARLKGEKGGG